MEEKVKDLIKNASLSPGIYIFKNPSGVVIYVGKARRLRDRLKSYLQYLKSDDPKLRTLGGNISDMEIIRTNNEIEALILESNLIKKYKPRYNILLKDDKAYPYIKINLKREWPLLEVVRRFTDDGALYFGPYTSARGLNSLIKVINKAFPLRKCNDTIFKTAKRPCINYQMHSCLAPCQGEIKREDYMGIVNAVISVLKGKTNSVIDELEKEMLFASDSLDFEEAARIRERIKVLETLYKGQSVVLPNDTRNIDVISCQSQEKSHAFNILLLREGMLLGQSNFTVQGEATSQDALRRFLVDYYVKNIVPDVISIPFDVDDFAIEEYIKSKAGNKKILISTKTSPEIKRVKKIGEGNLEEYLKNIKIKKSRWELVSGELAKALDLSTAALKLIECYDMSNTSGQFTVGAKVVFSDGAPFRNNYRKYKMKGDYRGDDIKAMQEVLTRRLKRINEEPLPDLIILDGGRTQLNAVKKVFKDIGIKNCPLISIAKDKKASRGLSKDKIYGFDKEDKTVTIKVSDTLLNFIKMIRDEAHRFVITYHREVRKGKLR